MKQTGRLRQIRSIVVGVCAFAFTVWLIVFAAQHAPVELLTELKTKSVWLSCLIAVGLYIFKCIDFVVHVGLIYASVTLILPKWGAVLMNLIGTVIMIELPYAAGRLVGRSRAMRIWDRFPRLLEAERYLKDHVVIFSMLTRMLGVPLNVLGVYMGAADYDHRKYTFGSMLGFLPTMVCFMVMGVGAAEHSDPSFWIALGVQITIAVGAILVFHGIRQRDETSET